MDPGPGGGDCHVPWEALPRAHGEPPVRGRLRQTAEDFWVDEDLGFEPEGDGPHVLLQLRKRGLNTADLARRIAGLAGVRPLAVGFSGLKDRNAVTTQWFSVEVAPAAEPDWDGLADPGVEVLRVARHRRKLRRGSHRGNRFAVTLRDLAGPVEDLQGRVEQVAHRGVPNYFGDQRFGRDEANVGRAASMLAGGRRVRDRGERGLLLSAARSALFNRVLAHRVEEGTWDRPLVGEAMVLEGSHSYFRVDAVDPELQARVAAGDVHPSGPLWGAGEPPVSGQVLALEAAVLAPCAPLSEGLAAAGLRQERRALRLLVSAPGLEVLADGGVRVTFQLPAGAYATAVLRELVRTA